MYILIYKYMNIYIYIYICHNSRRLDGGLRTKMDFFFVLFFPKLISDRRPFVLTCTIQQQESTRADKFGSGKWHSIQTDFHLPNFWYTPNLETLVFPESINSCISPIQTFLYLRLGSAQMWGNAVSEVGPKVDPNGPRNGTAKKTKWDPNRMQNPKWDRSETQDGTEVVTEVGPKWDPNGTQMGPNLSKHWFAMCFSSFQRRAGVGPK